MSSQLPDGRIISVVNGNPQGYICGAVKDPITGKAFVSASKLGEVFVDYIHEIAIPLGYPQIPGYPPGTLFNINLVITGKGWKNNVTQVTIGGNPCSSIIYAATVTLPDGSAGCALQCVPPTGLGKGDYDVVVTAGGTDYQANYGGANIQFKVKEATDGWTWTYNGASPKGILTATLSGNIWGYGRDGSNRINAPFLPTGDNWTIVW